MLVKSLKIYFFHFVGYFLGFYPTLCQNYKKVKTMIYSYKELLKSMVLDIILRKQLIIKKIGLVKK